MSNRKITLDSDVVHKLASSWCSGPVRNHLKTNEALLEDFEAMLRRYRDQGNGPHVERFKTQLQRAWGEAISAMCHGTVRPDEAVELWRFTTGLLDRLLRMDAAQDLLEAPSQTRKHLARDEVFRKFLDNVLIASALLAAGHDGDYTL